MSFPLINPYQQFFDSSGSPLANGTIEFRDPTTNDLINSYPTADDADAQTNANANPLTLNASGAAANGLFLEDGVAYKVILKDSSGATVDTADDVRCPVYSQASISQKFYPQTAAESSAGVTPTNYQYEPLDVRRYGATGDGTTDDATAIQNAFDVAAQLVDTTSLAQKNKPTVWFPPSDGYVTTVGITSIMGINIQMDAPLLVSAAATAAIIGLDYGTDTTANILARNVNLVLDVRRVTQSDWLDPADIAIQLRAVAASNIWIRRADNFDIGVKFTGAYNNVTIGEIRDCRTALWLVDTTLNFTNQNVFHGGELAVLAGTNASIQRIGIHVDYAGTFRPSNNRFYDTSHELNAGAGGAQPIIVDGGWRNRFYAQRRESSGSVLLQCTGDARWNIAEDLNDVEVTSDTVTSLDDQSTYEFGNAVHLISDYHADKGYLIFDSGLLGDIANYYSGSAYHIPNLELLVNTNPCTFSRSGGLTSINADKSVTLSTGIWGVRIKTNKCRLFAVSVDHPTGADGTLGMVAFDSAGLQLTANTDVLQNAATPTLTANTGVYGGLYSLTTSIDDPIGHVVIRVSDNVDELFIGFYSLQLYGFKIFGLEGEAHWFNGYSENWKDVSLSSAAPTVGTWQRGKQVFDDTPSASGTIGWVCTASGTFSSATDATGDTDGSGFVITGMTDTSDFNVGDFVTVSAGFPSASDPYRIRAKTATSVTLYTASTSAQTNVTVATVDPVFKTFGTIAA